MARHLDVRIKEAAATTGFDDLARKPLAGRALSSLSRKDAVLVSRRVIVFEAPLLSL